MELSLRLGSFLDHHNTATAKMATADLGFCMALGTGNTRADIDHERIRVCSSEEAPVQLDLLPFSPVPRAHHPSWLTHQKLMPDRGSSDGITTTTGRSALPAVEEADDGAALSSPNSTTVSSFQMDFPARNGNNNDSHKRDMDQMESERGLSDEDDNALTRKKLRLSKDQSAFLEQSFTEHTTLNPKQKLALAKQLNLRPRQVEVWFQNRRARTKLKQTEVDCEYLKKCCEKLSEENRRLHKELQELRALKTSQPFYNQLPATTLTMCPSCERVATTTSAATAVVTTPSTTVTTNTNSSSSSPVALSIVKPRSMFPLFCHAQPQPQAQAH